MCGENEKEKQIAIPVCVMGLKFMPTRTAYMHNSTLGTWIPFLHLPSFPLLILSLGLYIRAHEVLPPTCVPLKSPCFPNASTLSRIANPPLHFPHSSRHSLGVVIACYPKSPKTNHSFYSKPLNPETNTLLPSQKHQITPSYSIESLIFSYDSLSLSLSSGNKSSACATLLVHD